MAESDPRFSKLSPLPPPAGREARAAESVRLGNFRSVAVAYEWRGGFDNAEVNALHAEAFAHRLLEDDWYSQVHRYSLGWVCARRESRLVGFVNVAWDGGVHAFILDTIVSLDARREGIGKGLIAAAIAGTREADCCEWLYVGFEEHLRPFYFNACGFTPTDAGVIALQ